jgi:V8-like Glu-specific endopeptidase
MKIGAALKRFAYFAMIICALSLGAQAQQSTLIPLQTMQDSRGWTAVGRLDIQGKGFCTAALIRDRLILTAAHCVFDSDGTRIDTGRYTFRAGLRDGRAEATRAISRTIPHPDYRFNTNATDAPAVALDIAVMELDRPIREARLRPYMIAPRPLPGDAVRVVSYGRGRSEAPSLQESCRVLGRDLGVIVMTCNVEYGSSGSPVFMLVNGEMRIASVVSAMAQMDGERVALGASLLGPLNTLLSHYGTLGPTRSVGGHHLIGSDERNDTGAKFIRP